jgi:2-(1,2-epoxy-1,2-dihydrophenyl)acetyl-CoA isomerase
MIMTGEPTLLLREFDAATGIATLTFQRPDVFNALDIAAAAAFEEAVAWLLTISGLRCVVITGAGKAFMAGGDVSAFARDLPGAPRTLAMILRSMHPALLDLRALDAPVIAAVNGSAAGAGFSLALGADYVLAKATSKFVLAYDKLGVAPDCGGSWFLARKVGRTLAFELMLLGRTLTAEEAKNAGIVNEVVDDGMFDERLADLAGKIASGPTLAFGMFKRLMDEDVPLATHLERERRAFMDAAGTEDFQTAATAFVEKRRPEFKGR